MDRWLTNDRFLVLFGGIRYGFSKVSNMAAEMEYDSIVEGGRNWSPHLFSKPSSKLDTMTFERGRAVFPPPLSPTLEVGTCVEMVIIMVNNGQMCHSFGFDWGMVTKLTYGDLDALHREILIEKMEIAHSGLHVIKIDQLEGHVTSR